MSSKLLWASFLLVALLAFTDSRLSVEGATCYSIMGECGPECGNPCCNDRCAETFKAIEGVCQSLLPLRNQTYCECKYTC
ncbi:hypothetical protein CDL15_Pgr016002 [Punica granatum]|uniref:Uncharacterized protein n=1 Tax=Punica granatum TaxID=22663 RepID=A0A218XQM5_PUNGR|nr:hypothetical protein CDL15_Pgr016002 [Punica granatum]